MPLLNSAIPLFAFAALVISEDCCSVASLNYSMPSLHSVTLCRCCAHIFFTPPLLCSFILYSALATRRSATLSPRNHYLAVLLNAFAPNRRQFVATPSQLDASPSLALPSPLNVMHCVLCHCSTALCKALPSHLMAGRHQALASRRLSSPHHAVALKARTRPCSLRSARTRTCPLSCYATGRCP